LEYFIEIVKEWGYLAVLLGSMIEGESVILTACVMAYMGYLSIAKIVGIAFFGTLVADQGLYYVGRLYGHKILERFPKLKAPSEKAFTLLHKWDLWFILSFRFIYGIRIVSPIVIGTSGVPPRRFIPLNFVAALVWTSISCTGGYLLGGIIDAIEFAVVERYIFLISAALLAILITGGYFAWKKLHHTPNGE
jgi:membrane protein DedA with SNARE-associated domain